MSHENLSAAQCWAGFGLTVTVSTRDATRAGLRLVGELDVASAPLLGACLEYHLDTGRRFVRANLAGLSFVDSAGLDIMSKAHWAFIEHGGTFILTDVNARTRRLVQIVGLDTVLLIAGEGTYADAPVG